MESWSFGYVGKGLVSDESKSQIIFGNNMIVSPIDQMGIENQGFGDMCFPQIVGNSVFSTPVMAATRYAFFEENESSSKLSGSVSDSDLNLNRIVNQEIPNMFTGSNNLCSSEVSMPSKQTRVAGSPSPFCQVLGCNKSLISCKDYHKRHKVCEIHSKTAKVIVKGVEQRFCQQCSRFHLLSEFDDGKRSCRKRLADHNERRRKPHVGGHYGRHGRLLPSCRIATRQIVTLLPIIHSRNLDKLLSYKK
ncbi:Transcription factor, SBP-box [Cynara cardunculus var. scolymus]|uniref:Transcription factor, SBP-box n=1 Tax=Cynara cardunculus var. scolymus TaxID=59895 RepID=A0A103YC83_CYNCS|nr:Transcription factor, SBP-box [Cynara cardunculus var. scolymus]